MNYYKQAIDILSKSNIEYRKVCIEIAKSNPSVFVKAAMNNSCYSALDVELMKIYQEKGKIHAIKRYREVTGHGIKESKIYVESIIPD